ncbi:MAG TPA: hypothetical protein VGO58_11440 [Chitinophagaceae bacterium]|nr:hypothetical protein [Chitinophagaceae bacterium]
MKSRGGIMILVFAMIANLDAGAQKFDAALTSLAAKHQPEKIYIHYDKEYYVAGETIWFKAYLYNDGKPSANNNNLLLQFTDSKGKLVSNKMFPVMGAVAKGSIQVPDSLPQGNYYVRAFTPAMMNYEEGFIYKKNIFVFRPSAAAKEKTQSSNISVQFFPESGELVDNILSVVGFKAVDQWGTPAEVNGVLRLEDGTTIASFKTYHDGIGKIQFKAQAGKKYIAEVETDAGKRTYSLPEVKTTGINLKIQDEKGGKKFQLTRSEKDKAQFETVWLVAQINNHLVYENEIKFDADYPSIIGHLLTDSLPSGILHFTVFNSDGMPLAERLSFVDNREYASKMDMASLKTGTEKRAENTIELNFPDLVQRSCSVSITDMSGSSFNDNDNIWSRLLLTSDLKGHVHNPGWYFTNPGDSTKQALDNLMLTHGWSRFNWTKILANEFPAGKPADRPFISVSGKVVDDKTKQPLPGGKLNFYLEAEDSTSLNLETTVDDAGQFKIDSLMFGGKAELYYVFTDKKGKERSALIVVDDNGLARAMEITPSTMLENTIARDVNTNSAKEMSTRFANVKSYLDEVKELEKVTVESKSGKKPEEVVNEKYTTGVFRSPGKVTLDNINEPANDRSMNVVDYIKNRVQQVEIQNNQFVNRKNMSLMSGQKWVVGVFLNEVPSDIFQLRVLRVGDVALVKFFEAGFVGVGSAYPGGALSVYTKEKMVEKEKPDKLAYVEYKGYSISRQFYMPDYNNKEIKQPTTDNRTTLYWNPDVYTDTETRSVKLNFFNNDFGKKFKVVVEGFDGTGKLIHLEKIIGN